MNFLDAHIILYNYCNLLTASPPIDGVLCRKSALKNNTNDILNSYKLFLAHMYFYHTRTQEEYEALQARVNLLPSFVDDYVVDQYLECKRIVEDKSIMGRIRNKTALPFAKEKMQKIFLEANQALINFYSSDESRDLDRFTGMIAKEANEAYSKIRTYDLNTDDGWNKMENVRQAYCDKAYSLAGVPEDYYDSEYFFPIRSLKALADDPKASDVLTPYKDYLLRINE